MPVATVKESEYVVYDPGIYEVTIESIEHVDSEFNKDGQWKWTFLFPDGSKITNWSSPTISEKSKAGQWIAGLGYELAVGEDFDTDQLIGMKCVISIALKTDKKGEERNSITGISRPMTQNGGARRRSPGKAAENGGPQPVAAGAVANGKEDAADWQ